jgi:hypothetical protein
MEAPIPKGFDAARFPIIATHFFGIELSDVREVYWSLAQQGFPPMAEPGVILLAGGRS